ncbi:MAG: FG-GAP repeat protein [Polyangiales bacterium]
MRVCFLLTPIVAACNVGGPSLDELNAVRAAADPTTTATAPGAPFLPGQRRAVADANTAFVVEPYNQWVTGVTLPGDLDRDGFDDLVLWGRLANPPDTVPCDRGCPGFDQLAVRVVYGAADFGRTPRLTPGATLLSWHLNSARGHVAAAGDVDGDGAPDLLVSVGTEGCEQGNVFVVRGGARLRGVVDVRDAGALLRETGGCQRFGEAAGVGDLDRDGRADFAVATPTTRRVHLFYGAPGTPPPRRSEANADAHLVSSSGAVLGAPTAAGDVDGDGRGDLIGGVAAAPGDHDFWLLRGAATRFAGEVDVDRVGTRITAATLTPLGDLDGDGRHELGATRRGGERDGFVLAGRRDWPARSTWARRRRGSRVPRARSPPPRRCWSPRAMSTATAPATCCTAIPRTRRAARGSARCTCCGAPSRRAASRSARARPFSDRRGSRSASPRCDAASTTSACALGAADFNGDGLSDLVLGAPGAPDGGRVYVWMGRRAR